MTDSIRIFQLAKELNISHTDIVNFLKEKGISVTSHMSPIDGKTQQIVYTEFAKDRQSAERDRKEQVRKEIHDSKVVMETKSVKKFKILSVQDQREQAKPKKVASKDVKEDKKTSKDTKLKKTVEKKAPKKKLRKITLRESVSPLDKKEIKKDKEAIKKDTSAVKRLKKTLASMDSSPKKKSYKKAKKDTDIVERLGGRQWRSVIWLETRTLNRAYSVCLRDGRPSTRTSFLIPVQSLFGRTEGLVRFKQIWWRSCGRTSI